MGNKGLKWAEISQLPYKTTNLIPEFKGTYIRDQPLEPFQIRKMRDYLYELREIFFNEKWSNIERNKKDLFTVPSQNNNPKEINALKWVFRTLSNDKSYFQINILYQKEED